MPFQLLSGLASGISTSTVTRSSSPSFVKHCRDLVAMVNIVLKWNKLSFNCELDPTLGVLIFKSQVYSLTGVPPERQKLMAKGAWPGVLKDDADMSMMPLPDGLQVLLMGTADSIATPSVKVEFVEDMPAEEQLKKGAVVPAGFANLGNTCYMNATLQCFRAMDSLRNALERIGPGSVGKQCSFASVDNKLFCRFDIVSEPERNASRT